MPIVAKRIDALCEACRKESRIKSNEKLKESGYFQTYKRDPEKSREHSRKTRIRCAEKIKETKKRYHERNAGLKNFWDANRRAAEKQATPAWADQFIMKEAFHLAKLREKATGFKWHVDHIVPLQSRIVCGLHAHTNIQVIPATVNMSKNNVMWPDMP